MLDQQTYFDLLLELHPSKLDMVQRITSILSLSKDAVYRRMRGATALTVDEYFELQRHYQVNHDGANNSGLFKFNFAEKEIKCPGDYLDQLEERLAKIKALDNLHLLIANPGLPFFHEMIFPRLIAFKFYIYGSTCWNFPGWRGMKFRPELIDKQVVERSRAIGAFSYSVPGKELWTLGILTATLDQIEFMHLNGNFADYQQADLLLDELQELVKHLERMSAAGKKFLPESKREEGVTFTPAHNELANNDNVILVESDQGKTLFATFITPNFLQTADPTVINLTRKWFYLIDEMSTPLGASAGKQRNWYFSRLQRQIDTARARIHSGLELKFHSKYGNQL